ncbi:hypothetical protein [Paractinoplanes toevensis]|uniref:Uncharacterized protein n=1 Tax=Paractinoplanes toevensis TaxID=571911 RepID=A0A919W706_9ACTN|nr:hypothetical protein [Actinoplanes toevensis]GIM95615.1 hypothetical protein Ato02nite_074080 [Actinoplanes toevensis]
MFGGNYAPLLISASALAISIYGVLERHRGARRSEWLRLTAIVADLDALYFEQLKTPDGLGTGDFTDAINSRREVLSFQALALLPGFEKKITSSELRVLAYALSRAGYPSEAERAWLRAILRATSEGATQTLFAHRGYAYFLFAAGRSDDARAQMRLAVSSVDQDDNSLVKAIETLKFWSTEEVDGGSAGELLAEARRLADLIQIPRVRAQMHKVLGPGVEGAGPPDEHN